MSSLERDNLTIEGAFVLTPKCHEDNRGSFQELFNDSQDAYGFQEWKQVNRSVSNKGVVRGIHRSPYPKLVSVMTSSIWDVVVDLRPTSPTYLQWDARWLMSGGAQMFVPAYCGHGFFSPCDGTIVVYLQGGVFDPFKEVNVHWRDDQLKIEWPEFDQYILSEKDLNAPKWSDPETTLRSYLNRIKDKFTPEQLDIIKGMILDYGIEAIRYQRVRREVLDARLEAFNMNNSRLRD